MDVASLGIRTDLMLLALAGSQLEPHGGLLVVRTPANPDFWWGNFVLAPGPAAVDDAVALAARALPAAAHLAVAVDGTDCAPGVEAAAARHGLEVERITVLTADAVRPPARPAAGAQLRRLEGDADFAQCVDLQLSNFPESGRAFVTARVAAWRALQEAGHGAWFGAFVGGVLRSGLGLFTDGRGLARFQAVDTHADFRRRGLAGSLVHHAATAGLAWPGVRRLVIAAEPEYHAIRLYRALGFDGTQTQTQLLRRPPAGSAEAG